MMTVLREAASQVVNSEVGVVSILIEESASEVGIEKRLRVDLLELSGGLSDIARTVLANCW